MYKKHKKISGIFLRFMTCLTIVFSLLYGFIFVFIDLTQTISFSTAAEAAAARKEQLMISIPFIILGITLFLVLSVFYISERIGSDIPGRLWYDILLVIIGTIYTVGFITIAILVDESIMILCIAPSLFLLLYGLHLTAYRRKPGKTN